MATGGAKYHPWDKRNPEEQGLVVLSKYHGLLINAGPMLIETLRLENVWSQLLRLNVVSPSDRERLTHNTAHPDQVEHLLQFIRQGPTWKFHALMRACEMTDQSALIRHVGVNSTMYRTSTTSDLLDTNCSISEDMRKALREHCEICQSKLMKCNLFDLGDRPGGTIIDVSKCYVTIEARFNSGIRTQFEIATKDIFKRIGDKRPPNTVLLSGDSGSGKTLYAMDMVYEWSGDMLGGEDGVISDVMWTMMVYLPAGTITGSVEDAIKDCLFGHNQDILMEHVRKGEKVAVILDAIDEVRNDEVMAQISDYVRESQNGRGPKILVTARTDQCQIDSRTFDRCLVFPGFTAHQGHEYIDRFFHMDQFLHEEMWKKVINYVSRHEVKLEPVLTNPLKLHIFCALLSQGRLVLEDDHEFSLLELYTPLEEYLIDRKGVTVSEKEQTAFYHVCLLAQIKGYRELPESLLAEFRITDAYKDIFLEKCVRGCGREEKVTYRFPHESFFEFFASRFIQSLTVQCKKALILRLCAQKSLRTIQRFVLQGLTQLKEHKYDLLQTMVQAVIVLQHEDQTREVRYKQGMNPLRRIFRRPSFYRRLVKLKEKFKATQSDDELLKAVQDKRQVNKDKNTSTEINNLFENNTDELRAHQWWFGLDDNGTLDHVAHCLQDIGGEHQQTLTRATIYQLLPCIEEDPQCKTLMGAYPVASTRWATLKLDEDGVWGIYAWCIDDVCELLEQYKVDRAQRDDTRVEVTGRGMCLYINKHRDVWGTPPDTTWSQADWYRLLLHVTQVCGVTGAVIVVDYTTPLTGLMAALLDAHTVQDQVILVGRGTIGMYELITCVDKCQHARVGLVLESSRIVVPDGESLGTLRANRNRLRQMINHTEEDIWHYVLKREEGYECKWLTTGGDDYNWQTEQQTDRT